MPAKKVVKSKRRSKMGPQRSLRSKVLRIVNNQRETKVAVRSDPATAVTKGMNNHMDFGLLMPEIPGGTASHQRIGNTITLTKLVIRGYYAVQFPNVAYDGQRIQIRQFINSQKGTKNAYALSLGASVGGATYNNNNLLEPSKPYNGSPADYMTPVNSNAFSCRRDRRWTLKTGIQSTDPTNNQQVGDKTFVYFTHTLTFGKGKKLHYKTDTETPGSNATNPVDFPYFLSDSQNSLTLDDGSPAQVLREMTCTAYYFDS